MAAVSAPPSTTLFPLPFKTERHLRAIVHRCHSRLLFQHGHDQAKSFDELLKVLVAKIYDELSDNKWSGSVGPSRHNDQSIAELVRGLFQKASETELGEIYKSAFPPTLDIDDASLAYIAKQLAPSSITGTLQGINGMDVSGVAFESMVGSTFRGNLGAYFTPRNIVQFMVQMIDPDPIETIIDPACGSGGFLVGALRYVRAKMAYGASELSEYAKRNLAGVDINERMTRVAKMNMVMHGCPDVKIVRDNGLAISASDLSAHSGFDICLANPPFAGFESDPEVLQRFETGRSPAGKIRSVNKVIPFVEKIIQLLCDGGRAGLVLPVSVLNAEAQAFERLRQILLSETRLLAIIGLPQAAFHHTDCGSHGVLLFFERRKNVPDDYEVFIDWAEDIGYDTIGRPTARNDFVDTFRRYRTRDKANLISIKELRSEGRLDPEWWHPRNRDLRIAIGSKISHLVPLSTFFRFQRRALSKQGNYLQTFRYFEVSDTNPQTGEVERIREAPLDRLPGRVRLWVEPGDILLPNHRDSLKAGRSAVIVPQSAAGCLTTNRFMVLKPLFDRIFLKNLLNSPYVRQQLLMRARGGASLDVRDSVLDEIMVPPLTEAHARLIGQVREAHDARLNHLKAAGRYQEKEQRLILRYFAALKS